MTESEGRTLNKLADRVSGLGSLLRNPEAFTNELRSIARSLGRLANPPKAKTPSSSRSNERGKITPGTRYTKKGPVRVEVRKRAA
jgi:hypothetical protein